MDNRPIGVFDSGLGGLTVLAEIKRLLPNENLIYLGDTARVPYGTRSKEIVTNFSFEDAKFLLSKDVKCIVVACNTASALAGEELKNKLHLPVFEVITPTSKVAVSSTKNKKIGVIGTRATISSGAYKNRIKELDSKVLVFESSCPLFVSFIEEGETQGELLEKLTKKYLSELKQAKIDTLILGCTHYPVIVKTLAKEIGENVELINPGVAVSHELKDYLTKNKSLNANKSLGKSEYFVTDLTDRFVKVAEMFLREKITDKIERVSLE